MCDTCGCNVTDGNRHLIEGDGKLARTESGNEAISVLQSLLSENDRTAAHNREHFDRHRVLAINLMSSPGSGKTRLLEETITLLGDSLRIAVIEGDLETENDAQRIREPATLRRRDDPVPRTVNEQRRQVRGVVLTVGVEDRRDQPVLARRERTDRADGANARVIRLPNQRG